MTAAQTPAKPTGIAAAYLALRERSLAPGEPVALAAAILSVVPGASEHPPAGFGTDPARDAAWLEEKTRSLASPWPAVRAMALATGDPHTILMSPSAGAGMMAHVTGGAATLPGLAMHRAPGEGFLVGEVVPGGPSEAAGVRVGDRVVALDGAPVVRGMEEVLLCLGRPDGSSLRLDVERAGAPVALALTLGGGRLPVAAARVVSPGVGVARLRHVVSSANPGADGATELAAAVKGLVAAGVTRIVLDLRSNPGGYGVSRHVALFTRADPVIVYRDRSGAEELAARAAVDSVYEGPLAVLVDEQTLSSAEMIALALQDAGRAKVVGTATAGGLNVPTQVPLGDGYVLMMPLRVAVGARSRRSPEGMRVAPDVVVPNRTGADLAAGRDPQLDAAVELLRR